MRSTWNESGGVTVGVKKFFWILLIFGFLTFFANIPEPRLAPDIERKAFHNPDLVTAEKMCYPGEFLHWSDEAQVWKCSTDN